MYLFVQDGVTDLYDPVTIPYRAWSYFYPLGIVTSSFSHASFGHLLGNLIAAAVVAPSPSTRGDTTPTATFLPGGRTRGFAQW